MTLLVRDEEDILEANLSYHLAQGVDHVIVTDNLSVDRSPDIIQPYVDQGVATYIRETDDTYSQSRWVSRMAAMAHEAGADWVIHCDADEFWMAPETSLKKWFARQWWHNIISANRHDFICLEDDGSPFWQRMVYRKSSSTNPLGLPLPPKVAHRANSGLTVAQGNHAVSGFLWPRIQMSNLEILHFPLRSREQYIHKIENGGRAYTNNTELDHSVGNTWRKQYTELQETGTLTFLENNIVSVEALQSQLADGAALVDKRLATFLEGRG
ncbi:glycosyltransferase family 2 protein [Aliiroseovarius sediminilitoris]|nr:glycosyltransferase family 2 protein [Aliiroseovarius sediminilitoris]